MAVRNLNITVDPKVYQEFCEHAEKQGIKTSTWVNAKMKEFIEEQQVLEELRKQKR